VDVYLETPRLVLRRFTAADVELLVELDSDVEVMRYLTGKPTPRVEIEARILGILTTYEQASGRFIGWFGLQPTAQDDVTDLGYRLHRSGWGRGYASEGSRGLIAKAFTELGIRRVEAQTMAVNTKSRRVMEKAGLRFQRVYHEHFDDPLPGTEHGEVEYGIDRDTWQQVSR
jgi:RimJ/RimL family protein N-acetyltransferase